MTKKQAILNHLKKFKKITPAEAYEKYHTMRLSAAIFNLKKLGYKFKTEKVRVPTRDGWAYVAQYSLEEA